MREKDFMYQEFGYIYGINERQREYSENNLLQSVKEGKVGNAINEE